MSVCVCVCVDWGVEEGVERHKAGKSSIDRAAVEMLMLIV